MLATKKEQRQHILTGALGAFSERGFAKTTVDDIVRLSRLRKGTLYWHFEDKQEHFVATIEASACLSRPTPRAAR